MAVKTVTELKAAFESGDRPGGQDFIDLVDTLANPELALRLTTVEETLDGVATALDLINGGGL